MRMILKIKKCFVLPALPENTRTFSRDDTDVVSSVVSPKSKYYEPRLPKV